LQGCVVSCLAYSTTQLGNLLGGYGSGVLYIFYALTAFFLAKPVVSTVGPKNGLLLGVSGYCVYVCGFLFAILVPVAAWPVFILSCMIGGMAGGLLWTSQGMYFAQNSKLYAEATGKTVETTNAAFAGIFATAYLGIEMVAKVMATVIFVADSSKAPPVIFSLYTIMAILSCLVVNMLDDLQQMGTWDLGFNTIIVNSGAAAYLVYSDPRLMLMLPFQICFGFASSFVPYYVFGTIINNSNHLGSAYVGLLSAVIVATGASMAIPSSWAAIKFGKPIGNYFLLIISW
jgi:Ion channel regulatory protein UNC-93